MIEDTKKTATDPEDHVDVIVFRQKRFKIQTAKIKKLSAKVSSLLGLEGWELCIKFVGKKEIAELNKVYRHKDYPTDVLSFPQTEWEERIGVRTPYSAPKDSLLMNTLGDIVICPAIAEENAEKIGQSLDREVCFLIVHGILHLCGHDHEIEEEERIMLEEQRMIMESLSRDLAVWKDCVRVLENI